MKYDTSESTIIDEFRRNCERHPDRPLCTFVDEEGCDQESLTHRQALEITGSIAGFLVTERGLRPGDRVLLAYPPSLDFVSAFAACLLAGIVPVPVCLTNPFNVNHDLTAFASVAASSGAKAVLSNRAYGRNEAIMAAWSKVWQAGGLGRELPWHLTDEIEPGRYTLPALPPPSLDTVAFLQYTSGSTSTPKGVMLTYRNLRHQLECNALELGYGEDTRIVFWVPHYHDLCLISGICSALHGNGHLYLMSPITFIKAPERWFEVMSRVRATVTAAPNFAYDYAFRRTTPAQREAWDLGSLRVIMNAAEPVNDATMRAFVDAFSVCGVRPEAICPAYGLAEHSVGVSVFGRGVLQVDRDAIEHRGVVRVLEEGSTSPAKTLVGCGKPSMGVTVRVVDPETCEERPAGHVGEIWVDSDSKGIGYYGLEEESERTFRAALAKSDDPHRYLRTGDLGFLHDGQLYITGRQKDVVIIRGRNVYPQDIEDSLRNCHPLVRPGGIAVFSVDAGAAGTEELVVVVETRNKELQPGEGEAIVEAVRRRVQIDHQLSCAAIFVGRVGIVQKTTSGKLRRQDCRKAFQSGALERSKVTLHVYRAGAVPGGSPAGGATASKEAPLDPRFQDLDPSFERIIGEVGPLFGQMARASHARVFHKAATTLRGRLTVLPAPDLPPHAFFTPGAQYPVLVRHANGTLDDDAACDNRGASVRVIDPARPDDLSAALLDLLLTTGRAFVSPNAEDFSVWMRAKLDKREEIVRKAPHIGAAAWDMYRSAASSYTSYRYYSKVASHYVARDGGRFYVRYRLLSTGGTEDAGLVDPGGRLLPPERMPRAEGDPRSKTFLHEELRARVERGGVEYLLQVQVRPASGAEERGDEPLDCTRPWREDRYPWRDAARLHLDALADLGAVDAQAFNPCHAPPELGLVLARSPSEAASLNHLRSITYTLAAAARTGAPLSAALSALIERARAKSRAPGASDARRPAEQVSPRTPARALRIGIIGAGPSGLTAAWYAEELGHRVTVLERQPSVAGKCASIEIDGRAYDLGGHLCFSPYKSLAKLVSAVGAETEEATTGITYDIEARQALSRASGPGMREEWLRYQAVRSTSFRDALKPGFSHLAGAFAKPMGEWLAEQRLTRLGAVLGDVFTSSGYGFLTDPELPALYLIKFAETLGVVPSDVPSDLPPLWTPKGGFASLWRRVADKLRDVRCGVSIQAIERRDGRVRVYAGGEVLEFDKLIVASPLEQALGFLDATLEERELFGKIRGFDYYTTVCTARGLPKKAFYRIQQHMEDPGSVGHVVAFHHRYDDSDVILFYSFGNASQSGADIERLLREDVARMGGEVLSVHLQKKWAYFPHVTSQDARDGFFEKLEGLQGKRDTYYLGSIFNFELVECNVAYAEQLVHRFLGDRSQAAAAPPRRAEGARATARASGPITVDGLRAWLTQRMAVETGLSVERIDANMPLDALGLDSVSTTRLMAELGDFVGSRVEPAVLLDHRTIDALARHLAERAAEAPREEEPRPRPAPAMAATEATGEQIAYHHRSFDNGGALHYLHHPNPGKPILVGLPGFRDTARAFRFLEPLLAKNFELYLLDFRGHGDSMHLSEGCYSAATLLHDIAAFDARVLPGPYTLLGHCLGAQMGSIWAGLKPERLEALILIEGLLGLHGHEEVADRLKDWAARVQLAANGTAAPKAIRDFAEAEAIVERAHPAVPAGRRAVMTRDLLRTSNGDQLFWHHAPDLTQRWPALAVPQELSRAVWARITAPVLWLTSDVSIASPPAGQPRPWAQDREQRAASIEEIAGHFRDIEVHTLEAPETGLIYVRPEAVMATMRRFLTRIGRIEAARAPAALPAGRLPVGA